MSTNSFERLSRTVRSIAGAIGITAAVGIPASFGLVAYRNQVSDLTFKTELAAARLAEFIYVQGKTWRYNENRVADMLGFTRIEGHQVVYEADGGQVTEIGDALSGATLRVASPIVVLGDTVGRVEGEVSLFPLLMQISALTLLGLIFGGAVFFGALLLPRRALREATAAHDDVQRDLRHQVTETHSALMLAREATNAKSAFLAMMSHEIRTPMNAVMGLSSSLQESRLDSEQRHLVDTIYESSNSLLRLLNDILDFSKLDAGKIELESIPFSPAALLDHAVSIVAAKAAEKGLAIRFVAEPGLPAALAGDPARLQQVILNLAVNAIKFTESGAVELGARCLRQSAGAATIECWVRDTGIGIAPHQLGMLFTEFMQAELSISRRFGGTGLGLAICKRIIEQMDGKITVASTPGAGSTFTFEVTLPQADAATLHAAPAQPDGDGFATILTRLACPLRVLLAEDNATNQLVFSKLVQGFDIEVTVAADGREALEQAAAQTFDIVFMDMRMPVMDGLEATRAIRALGGPWSSIPIIALTANAFPEDVKMCHDAGMNDFISKPIRKKVLIERLAAMLADHPVVRAAREPVAIATAEAPPLAPSLAEAHVRILDHEIFDELVDAMAHDGVQMVFEGFVAETEARLALLRRLSCENDRASIRDEAHTLKGAAGTTGLVQLSELARKLEHRAPSIAPADYADMMGRLDTSFATAQAEFSRVLTTRAAA